MTKKATNLVAMAMLAVCSILFPAMSEAQPAPAPASISGHVTNPAGFPFTSGFVKLTKDKAAEPKDRKFPYSFPIDAQGNYKGDGIAPGDYLAVVYQDDKTPDFQELSLKAGEVKVVSFDMTRKEYQDKMSPEEKQAVEEFKKKNAEVMKANAQVQNLNQALASARADIKAANFDAATKTMQDATAQKPDEAVLWVTLGDAQLGSANAAQKAAREAHTSPMDVAIVQKFTDAAASYKKGIEVNAASKKPNSEVAAAAYNQLGQADGKSGDAQGAMEAYESAAKTMPANAGMYYFNEAATLFNAGKTDEAAAAADKAIAADPKKADAYYIKAQSLVTKASFDSKTNKLVAPPGCLEAYQSYLELAPDGPHAKDVKDVMAGFGQTVTSSFKANQKKK